ncbi:MAG TPA: bifunctional oligoribonuclease/PAP phosphatase NrnA [Candidatus Ozemobacteraceae bacterium]|nr:bifunctional oligoribonuclease/PAP phosphatase NrnA [Candidatus Ozemobacteraceae bacterium]
MHTREREALFAPIRAVLASAHSVLSIGHPDGDGDSIGSQLALHHFCRALGKRSVPLNFDPIAPSISWLAGCGDFAGGLDDGEHFDVIFLMETTDIGRMGDRARFFTRATTRIHLDHHVGVKGLGDLNVLDDEASSTCEILFDLLEGMDHQLTIPSLEALYVGIMTDTGNFRFPNTTLRSHEIAGQMLTRGVEATRLYKLVYEANQVTRILMHGTAMSRVTTRCRGKLQYTWLTREDFTRHGATNVDADGAINPLCTIVGTDVALLFRELESGQIKVSLRSTGRFDVCVVSRTFGGGGHRLAAGVQIAGPLERAIDNLLQVIEPELEKLDG